MCQYLKSQTSHTFLCFAGRNLVVLLTLNADERVANWKQNKLLLRMKLQFFCEIKQDGRNTSCS